MADFALFMWQSTAKLEKGCWTCNKRFAMFLRMVGCIVGLCYHSQRWFDELHSPCPQHFSSNVFGSLELVSYSDTEDALAAPPILHHEQCVKYAEESGHGRLSVISVIFVCTNANEIMSHDCHSRKRAACAVRVKGEL